MNFSQPSSYRETKRGITGHSYPSKQTASCCLFVNALLTVCLCFLYAKKKVLKYPLRNFSRLLHMHQNYIR